MADGSERSPEPADDLALVRAILSRKSADLGRLAERLRCIPRLLAALDRRGPMRLGADELSDLAQDVTVLVWRKLPEFEGLSSLEGWVYGFCLLEYRNAVRRRGRLRHEVRVAAIEGVPGAGGAEDPDPWAYEEVHDGLRRIGRDEARVIRLKHFEGRTFEEIGAALGISTNTAKSRYYRGLEELRPLLEPKEMP